MAFALLSKTQHKKTPSVKHREKPQPSRLQEAMNFRAVGGILTPISMIQTKLKVGEPHDRFEQEADQVADAVMRMADSSVPISIISARRIPFIGEF